VTTFIVGSLPYIDIQQALDAAGPNDTIKLESGHSNDLGFVTQTGLTVTGDTSNTGIELDLFFGATLLTLGGTAPFTVQDSPFGDTITGNSGNNIIRVSDGIDSVNGGLGTDRLVVDYSFATGAVTGNPTSGFAEAGGTRSVALTSGSIEAFTVNTGSGNDAITTGTGDDILHAGLGTNTISAGAGSDIIWFTGGNDTAHAGPGLDTLNLYYLNSDTTFTMTALTGSLTGYSGTITDSLGGISVFDGVEVFNITGGKGNDVFNTGGGDDTLSGGAGNDTLSSGAGNDFMVVGIGNDIVAGGGGTDMASYDDAEGAVTVSLVLQGSAQNTLGGGIDTLTNIENLTGSLFSDSLTGDAGANLLVGGGGNDTMNGGGGNDTLIGAAPSAPFDNDILNGGDGIDTASYIGNLSGVTVSLAISTAQYVGAGVDTLSNIENLTGTPYDDSLTGNAGNNVLQGLAGADTLNGGAGNDTLDGAEGNSDTASYVGAAGGVTVQVGTTAAQNTGGAGVDTLIGIENLTGSAFNDTLTGNGVGNILNGGAGNDMLNAGVGNDTLVGGDGNDTLIGGAGNDSLNGGAAGSDTASYADAAVGVTVSLATAAAQNTIGSGIDTLIGIENVTSSNLNDNVTGNAVANVLNGGAGNDTLTGAAGDDSLIGGVGNDSLVGGSGNDSLNGGAAGSDTASYVDATAGVTVSLAIAAAQNTIGSGTDTLINIENLTGSSWNDTLTGNAAVNVLNGGSGDDSLNGAGGNDSLIGGDDNDTLIGGAGNDSMDGGVAGHDTASYIDATAGVKVSLAVTAAQNTGGAGVDTLINFENLTGSNFNDSLTAGAAASLLTGGAGNDMLTGGVGNDDLIGGAGNDSLDGRTGTDRFIFDKGFGKDVVAGFVATGAAHDTLDFSTAVFANFAAVKSHMAQSGANVVITLDSADTITLTGVKLGSLKADDFTFHAGTAPAAPPHAAAPAWATHGAEFNAQLHYG